MSHKVDFGHFCFDILESVCGLWLCWNQLERSDIWHFRVIFIQTWVQHHMNGEISDVWHVFFKIFQCSHCYWAQQSLQVSESPFVSIFSPRDLKDLSYYCFEPSRVPQTLSQRLINLKLCILYQAHNSRKKRINGANTWLGRRETGHLLMTFHLYTDLCLAWPHTCGGLTHFADFPIPIYTLTCVLYTWGSDKRFAK